MSDSFNRSLKRKRPEDLDPQPAIEPASKSSRPFLPSGKSNCESDADVRWADYFGQWPPVEADNHDRSRHGRLQNKRANSPLISSSYNQSVTDGDSPTAWTPQHEEKIKNAGLVMRTYESEVDITSDCRRLFEDMKNTDCWVPNGPAFRKDRLLKMLSLAQFCNEARVVRDIMPLVVPSPELLSIDGHPGMDQMREAMDEQWTQCNTICGPRPRPTFAVGISPSAFTDVEEEELMLNHTSACPNLFPENMYFPFLICQVKDSYSPIQEAERQSMHSASIAVQAIIQLYRKISAADEVDRKILAFSVAHNNDDVKIYGHYAKVEGQNMTFFRCALYSACIFPYFVSDDWAKPYRIVRAIYELFFPQHLARIKDALARLRGRALESFPSRSDLTQDSQRSAPSQPSSQETGTCK